MSVEPGHAPSAGQPAGEERRRTADRRAAPGRREEDRQRYLRTVAATLLAFCGALAIMFLAFAAVGAVNLGDAGVFTGIAVVLALIWLVGAYQRTKAGGFFATRGDRERRGF